VCVCVCVGNPKNSSAKLKCVLGKVLYLLARGLVLSRRGIASPVNGAHATSHSPALSTLG
jgi:hypothetical protein